ncbi:KEOPS complex kinase/ATPase Bud32 [Candidatus Methanomassiliicoccus intestinalis]|uniref:KEOPS complex kinase/ATPase Bud32 n=1 Tax=Candidatus Methanomassiliicoccus intestinalis TaxID=1406512 RepID=UPI0037DD0A11
MEIIRRGAEAEIERGLWMGRDVIIKNRVPKAYRHPSLDISLRTSRTRNEARLIRDARILGVPTPIVYEIDEVDAKLVMEEIKGERVKDVLETADEGKSEKICRQIGRMIASLHAGGIVHGDLTTSNMIVCDDVVYLIDFSLGSRNAKLEEMGVDLHLLKEAFQSAHSEKLDLFDVILNEYCIGFKNSKDVMNKMKEIEGRGRYT